MIVKFFKKSRASSGAKPAVDYLLGEKLDREGARVLQGDPDVTVAISNSTQFSNKYTAGCMSFEEPDLPEDTKKKLMRDFERTLFAGLEPDQYNILWVEHTDKGRLELNFVVPNVELRTGKRLQPYYDKVDRPLMTAFQTYQNIEHSLSDPDDPSRRHGLTTAKDLPKGKKDAQELIHGQIERLVADGLIRSREDVIQALEGAGFEIGRTTKTAISIKDPDGGQNIRFKGAIYEQNFRVSEEFRKDIERRASQFEGASPERHQAARRELGQRVSRRAEQHKEKFTVNHSDSRVFRGHADYSLGTDGLELPPSSRAKGLERSASEASTPGEPNELRSADERGQLLPSRPEEEQRDIRQSAGQPRTKATVTERVKDYAERITERIKAVVSRVRRLTEQTAITDRTIDESEQRIDESERKSKRTEQQIDVAEYRITETSRAIESHQLAQKQLERQQNRGRGMSM